MAHPPRPLFLSLASTLLPVVLAAQSDDPVLQPVAVHVRTHQDGLPMPGVPVHVAHVRELERPRPPDGWLRPFDPRLHELRVSRRVHSDPDGVATVLLPDGLPGTARIFVGPPFWAGPLVRTDDRLTLVVGRLEQFSVHVVDAAGAPLPRFGVALHADGQERSVALTDHTGLALLGVQPDFAARLTVVPAGWILGYQLEDALHAVAGLRRPYGRGVLKGLGASPMCPAAQGGAGHRRG